MATNLRQTLNSRACAVAVAGCICLLLSRKIVRSWRARQGVKQIKGQGKVDIHGRIASGRKKVKRVELESFPKTKNDLILRAARGERTERTPVWMMRQAGRYLPEFRKMRETADFFAMCQSPELATEVTLQPLRRFPELDAVIVFSDILVIPQSMGMECQMVPGKGPVFPNPIRCPDDLSNLNFKPDLEETLGYVWDVVNLTRQKVNGQVPVIGFAGAPFTLMGYMIEGGGSRNLQHAKSWLLNNGEASRRLLQGLTDIIVDYVVGKVRYGAQLIQIFESNAGDLGPRLFEEFSLPYLREIAHRVKATLAKEGLPVVPITVFARNATYEGCLELLSQTEYDVISLDWGVKPSSARGRTNKVLQGNLDPCMLFANDDRLKDEVRAMIRGFGTERYIANLGHGMLPDHSPEKAGKFIDLVHEISCEINESGNV